MNTRRAAVWIVAFALPLGTASFVACSSGGDAARPGTPPDGDGAVPPSGDGAAPCTQIPMPDGGTIHVTGVVVAAQHPEAGVDAGPPVPIPNAMVSVEYGGTYVPWCDLAHASPYYVFGAITDDAGRFELDAREGALGFHAFANDYLYSRASLDTSAGNGPVTLKLEKTPDPAQKPTLTNPRFEAYDPATGVAPGASVTFSAVITAPDPKTDPLSDENLLVEPTGSWSRELDPPSLGAKDNFPNGTWKLTFPAPTTPGTYTYWFSATTSQCVTSDLVTATLLVK